MWRFKKLFNKVKSNFIFIGLASFLWLLFRTGLKPARIAYPCQQAALSSIGLLIYLLPAFYIKKIGLFFKYFKFRNLIKYSLIILIIFSLLLGLNIVATQYKYNQISKQNKILWQLAIKNADAQAQKPRVVTVHDSSASTWINPSTSPHNYMNQTVINKMVETGVVNLTGQNNPSTAWNQLLPTIKPNRSDEIVVVKLNFNNTWGCSGWASDPFMNPYAELANAIVDGLISAGISPQNIRLTDPSRAISDAFRTRITNKSVQYYNSCNESTSRPNVHKIGYVDVSSPYSTVSGSGNWRINPSLVYVEADHIINVPQLKAHGGASITLGIKNHYGSIDITNGLNPQGSTYHTAGPQVYTESKDYSFLVDINNNPVIRDKTRLILGDGLYGHPWANYTDPITWVTFNNGPPETLFFGTDVVAVDSVMADYLNRENKILKKSPRNINILYYAASIGLGVFDMWNQNEQYTLINYVAIDNDTSTQCTDNDLDGYGVGCALGSDCNDADKDINPSKTDICSDSIDQDCSGADAVCPVCPNGAITQRCSCGGSIRNSS